MDFNINSVQKKLEDKNEDFLAETFAKFGIEL